MKTAADLASRSLKLILVEAADAPLEPDEYDDYYDALNDFMAALEADGVRLGYTPVTNGADEVTVPPGAIRGIVANMAIEVAPDYGGKVSPALAQQAMAGMRTLERLGVHIGPTSLPDNLPRGTGNDDQPDRWGTHFGVNIDGVMWLAGNTVATDIVASGTPVRVRGYWKTDGIEGLQFTSTGRLANNSRERYTVNIDAYVTATCATAVTATFILMRNGAEQVETVAASLSATRADATMSVSVVLEAGEYLELWVSNDTDASDITVADARLEVE
jgi:hypothetical protein